MPLTLNTDLHHGQGARGDNEGGEASRDADDVYEGGEEEAETPGGCTEEWTARIT